MNWICLALLSFKLYILFILNHSLLKCWQQNYDVTIFYNRLLSCPPIVTIIWHLTFLSLILLFVTSSKLVRLSLFWVVAYCFCHRNAQQNVFINFLLTKRFNLNVWNKQTYTQIGSEAYTLTLFSWGVGPTDFDF